MKNNLKAFITASAVVLALGLIYVPVSFSAEKGYPVPDVSKGTLTLDERQFVADKTPRTEIDIKTFKQHDGSLVRQYSVGGAVFRYDVSTKGTPPYEYRLLDNDGDGVFETKEEMVGEMVVQDKGQKYFIDLGPEQGKEYKYSYAPQLSSRETKQILMGYAIFIPQWVILRFR